MKRLFLCFLAMTLSLGIFAQTAPSLLIGSDAAAQATGGTAFPRAAGAFSADNNAAAMSLADNTFDVAFTYGNWAPKSAPRTLLGLGSFYKLGDRLALGLSGRMDLQHPYETVDAAGKPMGSFSPRDIVAGVGVSYALAEGFSLGLTARVISSSLAEDSRATAFGADISAMYATQAFRAAVGVCNLGTSLNYGEARYAQPGLVRAGAAYSVAGFTASAEADYLFSGALMAGLGVEYTIAEIVSLRGGFHYGDAAKAIPTYASLGLGVQFAGVHLDAAFLLASKTLGNSLMIGLGYAF